MLRPLEPTTFTSTAPHCHPLSQRRLSPPARLSSSQARSGAVTEKDRAAKTKTKKKRDSGTETDGLMGN